MKKLLPIVGALALGVGVFVGIGIGRHRAALAREAVGLSRAEALFTDGRISEAAALVHQHCVHEGNRLSWADIQFRVHVAQMNLPWLTSLYAGDPNRILKNEVASLAVAGAFLHLRQAAAFQGVRASWKGRETETARWRILDADRLRLEGNVVQATEALRSVSFPGERDVPRLLRLALLAAKTTPLDSVAYLDRAAAFNASGADARAFRGEVLEALDRSAEARIEHLAAVAAAPSNPIWRDHLAEFHLRQGDPDRALETWTADPAAPAWDTLRLKAAFWSRMLLPSRDSTAPSDPGTGPLGSLLGLIHALPEGRFFDQNAFEKLGDSDSRRLADERPEVFWLRLTELLARGDECEALDLLASPQPGGATLNPDLERALARILTWRNTSPHSFVPERIRIAPPTDARVQPHPFFIELEHHAANERARRSATASDAPALAEFLAGPQAFAGAFLAAGWREAALRLMGDLNATNQSPAWLTYGIAQALRHNRGCAQALGFLDPYRRDHPSFKLLAAEIQIADGRVEEGRAALHSLATKATEVGLRAARLLSIDALEQGRPGEARRLVQANPLLALDTTGQELLARAALVEGDTARAFQAYEAIADESEEARAFLAGRPPLPRGRDQVQSVTRSLLDYVPDEPPARAGSTRIASVRGNP